MFKSVRKFVEGYRLISGTGHGGRGWDFPGAIIEMDMMMVERGMFGRADQTTRVQAILAYSHAFERENPGIDTSDMTPHLWAMAVFMMCHGAMREIAGYTDASAIAAQYGLKHKQSPASIESCCDWALQQLMVRKMKSKRP